MIGATSLLDLAVLLFVLALPLIIVPWLYLHPAQEPAQSRESEERAAALLAGLLSEDERQQLARCQYLLVPSPGIQDRVYRIPAEKGWVDVFDSDRLSMKLCVEPVEPLPGADVVLMHKLMIEGNESEYLRKANVARRPVSVRDGGRHPFATRWL